MNQVRRSFALAAATIAISTVLLLLWGLNRIIFLIGLSTVIDDAKNAPEGLIKLLVLVASMNHWVLLALAIGALGLQFWLVYQIFSYMDEAKNIHTQIKDLPSRMGVLERRLSEFTSEFGSKLDQFTSRFSDIVKFAEDGARTAILTQSNIDDIWPEMNRLENNSVILMAELADLIANSSELDEWVKTAEVFVADFDKFKSRVHSDLVSSREWEGIEREPTGIRLANYLTPPEYRVFCATFDQKVRLLMGINSLIQTKRGIAFSGNPLVNMK